jgi:cysteine dioxygenase
LILVWTPGKGSPIHDHADAHCLMKVLRGSLIETRYATPTGQVGDEKSSQPLDVIKESMYTRDQVAYMSDDLGLHRISNPSHDEVAVSLHCK